MAYKTNWQAGDVVKPDDLNRMEEAAKQTEERLAAHYNDLRAHENLQSLLIVSEAEPVDQRSGGLWLDTSDGPAVIGYDCIMVANAYVSDDEPENKMLLWFQTNATA